MVGVLSGSTGEKWANDNKAAQGFGEIKGYNTQQEVLLDLSAGRVDGVVSDVPGMEYAFTKMQGLAVVERIKTGEQYGLMVTKDSPLVEKLNGALTEMKKDGTLQRDPQEVVRHRCAGRLLDGDRSADAEGLIETALSR